MEIRSSAARVGASPTAPFRHRLADLRKKVTEALNDDWENPRFPLDGIDLSWLTALPRRLPRGSILNILV